LWLQQAIARLSDEQQRVIGLTLEALDFDEIAERLGKTEGACRQAYKRAIAALRRMMKETE
jgi:RNA polymerase sigma factor (sigma-70 family)